MLSCQPSKVREQMEKDPEAKTLISPKDKKLILSLPLKERGKILEEHLAKFEHDSKFIAMGLHDFKNPKNVSSEREWWKETIYLPFEGISLPAPKEYEKILERRYGDWKKFVRPARAHSTIFSTMISSQEYFANQH